MRRDILSSTSTSIDQWPAEHQTLHTDSTKYVRKIEWTSALSIFCADSRSIVRFDRTRSRRGKLSRSHFTRWYQGKISIASCGYWEASLECCLFCKWRQSLRGKKRKFKEKMNVLVQVLFAMCSVFPSTVSAHPFVCCWRGLDIPVSYFEDNYDT